MDPGIWFLRRCFQGQIKTVACVVIWAADVDWDKPIKEKGCQVNCFPGVRTRYHSAKGRLRGCEGRAILSLERRHPHSTGIFFLSFFFFFFFLLRMLVPDKKYQRKAQLLSAVPFCGFSHTKLCPACLSALCYYDRKKWISSASCRELVDLQSPGTPRVMRLS